MFRSIRAVWLLALIALPIGPGCRSAEGYRDQADADVYSLVRQRRATLGIGDGSFTIDPPKGSLRERLLRGETTGLGELTLVQCLEIAAENSRDYRSHEEALYLAALDLTLERWNFSVKENGLLLASVSKTPPFPETASASGDLTLTKVLGTGAKIVGNIGLDLSRALTSQGKWDPISSFGLAITQPLLRGAGSLVTYEPLTQAERNLVYAVRSFERYRRTFAFDVASRFYAILERTDEVRNQQANYDNLQKLSDRNAALAEAGRLDDIQAGQAKQDELRSLDNLLQAQEQLESLKDLFKVFLGLPPQIELAYDSKELERLAGQDVAPTDLDPDKAAELALASRLDHKNLVDQLADGERHVKVAADALRAGLNLSGSYSQPSEPGKIGTFNFSDSSWSLGAALDLPLDRMEERNAYRESMIAAEVSRRAVDSSEDTIRASLRDDIRLTKSTLESWKIQQGAVELAARRIESTDLKLQAGRALTRDLLDAQQSLLDTKNAASVALVTYTLSRLALFRDLELLHVDEQGIQVDSETLNAFLSGSPTSKPGEAETAAALSGGASTAGIGGGAAIGGAAETAAEATP